MIRDNGSEESSDIEFHDTKRTKPTERSNFEISLKLNLENDDFCTTIKNSVNINGLDKNQFLINNSELLIVSDHSTLKEAKKTINHLIDSIELAYNTIQCFKDR